MLFIHQTATRITERIVHLRARLAGGPDAVAALARDGAERLGPWLLHLLSRADGEVRTHWPRIRQSLVVAFGREELGRRAKLIRKWMKEHDTVPRAATTRRRERLIERHQRQEQRAAERDQRLQELAKKREKKELGERQTYSVYFE